MVVCILTLIKMDQSPVKCLKEIDVVDLTCDSSDEEFVKVVHCEEKTDNRTDVEFENEIGSERMDTQEVQNKTTDVENYLTNITQPGDAYELTCGEIRMLLEELKKHKGITTSKMEKIISKLESRIRKLKSMSASVHFALQQEIREITRVIVITKDVWPLLKTLVDYMTPEKATLLSSMNADQKKASNDLRVEYYRQKYQHELNELHAQILLLKDEDVDMSSDLMEEESMFIRVEEYKQRFMDVYYRMCDLVGGSHSTGRPVQQGLHMDETTWNSGYPSVNEAVYSFVQNIKSHEIPDFADVFDVIMTQVRQDELRISENLAYQMASQALQKIVFIVKSQRLEDLKIVLELPEMIVEDPSKTDPALHQKLNRNLSSRRSEAEVINYYVDKERELIGDKTSKHSVEAQSSECISQQIKEDSDSEKDDSIDGQVEECTMEQSQENRHLETRVSSEDMEIERWLNDPEDALESPTLFEVACMCLDP